MPVRQSANIVQSSGYRQSVFAASRTKQDRGSSDGTDTGHYGLVMQSSGVRSKSKGVSAASSQIRNY